MDTKKLRQKILDLAIHGKLVPQDPNDEPASVLLERIRAEKEKLIREGKIKAPKKSKSAGDTSHYPKDVPFEVPEGWAWCKIEEIAESNIGLTYKPEDVCSDGIPVLRSNNIKNRRICTDGLIRVKTHILPKQFIGKGDLLICARNGSRNLVGKCALIEQDEEPMSFGAFMAVCRSAFNRWIFLILNSSYFNQYLDNSNSTAINQVIQSMLLSFNIPLPPKNEQARIYSMVERLCSCVDELEKHEQVVLAKINDSRKRILELAIHGKLVPQDPTEEPAIELLKRINPAFEPSHNLHYEGVIPDGWQICKLSDLFKVTMGQSPDGTSLNRSTGIEFHQGKICFTEKYLSESDIFTTSATKCAEPNSLLCCVRAPVGVFNITSRRICIGRGLCSLSPLDADVDIEYWFYALSSLTEYYESMATGSTFKAISGDIIRNTVIAVPPKMEQQRILEQITCLFSILKKASDAI